MRESYQINIIRQGRDLYVNPKLIEVGIKKDFFFVFVFFEQAHTISVLPVQPGNRKSLLFNEDLTRFISTLCKKKRQKRKY